MSFADKDQVHGLSMLRHLLIRERVYSESMPSQFDSRAIPKVTSRKMVNKVHIRMMPMTQRIKFASGAFEKCVGHLRDVPIQMGELIVILEFLVGKSSKYGVIIGLPTMIRLRARPEYYRMILKFTFRRRIRNTQLRV